ncbi:sterol desaturase family protein [Undibacterium sp.]|uniref:sterol desaturase family protein n=1 Tax=Undibacterium sp. TaxID=1914977 RepID=UPI00374D4D5C
MGSIEKFLLLVALPVVLMSSLIEAVVLSRTSGYDWKALGVSVCDLALRTMLSIFLPLSIATPLVNYVWDHRLMTVALQGWVAFTVLFIGQEFCYYWYHRAAHRVRWFWGNHAVHHSPNELNLAAAYRIGIFGKLTGTALFFIPLMWLGFSPRVVAGTLTLNLLYQFWIHATWIPKLGWLEYVLNTPSAHRVHHASNLDYLDANYGGVLIVFDRLFGTYREERAELPCRYGLVHPITGYNLFHIETSQWQALARDLLAARSLKAFFGYLLMPPGWSPDGKGQTTEDLRSAHAGAMSDAAASATSPSAAEISPEPAMQAGLSAQG